MIIAFDYAPIVSGIISFVFGGGIVTAIVALFKVRPESGQIVVSAAQGALLVQTGVIENLKKEIERLQQEVTALKIENESLKKVVVGMQANQIKHDTQISNLSK